ncbi:MAG TPA: hypothetical protein VIU82_00310 [Bosea sp. (in: a-proteobacteria)]
MTNESIVADEVEALAYRSMSRAGIRVVNDDGRRWRLESVDGKWTMKPEGFLSAIEAQEICERVFEALTANLSSETAAREKAERERDEARAVQFDFARMSHDMAKLRTTIADLTRKLEAAAGALEWYGEQARLARLIHSEGDAGRHALANDGGRRAREAHAALVGKEKGL